MLESIVAITSTCISAVVVEQLIEYIFFSDTVLYIKEIISKDEQSI